MIKEKFPRQGHRINQLYEENPDFRALCADYFACMQELQKYKKQIMEEGRSIDEYAGIANELERELYDFIFPG
jgi:hypothetical protein